MNEKEMKGKVLLIDDDPDFRESTGKILQFRGYDVITAGDAHEARITLKKEKPDLIILDIMLPDIDGFTFCSEIKDSTDFFQIPILILTSVNKNTVEKKYAEKIALHHKADEFAEKPIEPKELIARVYGLITRSRIFANDSSDKKKILFIDNDHDFMRSVRKVLENKEYEIQTTDSGKTGMMMVKTLSPQIVIIDPVLSDIDGFTVCRELKSNKKTFNIPILMVSAFNSQLEEPDFAITIAKNHKVDEFIPKPIKAEALLEKIRQYV
ncbi:MAG TPA: response regulator transcription factor [Candidatus Cloacimonetes bacterium]|nr:response regulator transcription factor [Candidatus Cloacimonadota bacterium]